MAITVIMRELNFLTPFFIIEFWGSIPILPIIESQHTNKAIFYPSLFNHAKKHHMISQKASENQRQKKQYPSHHYHYCYGNDLEMSMVNIGQISLSPA